MSLHLPKRGVILMLTPSHTGESSTTSSHPASPTQRSRASSIRSVTSNHRRHPAAKLEPLRRGIDDVYRI